MQLVFQLANDEGKFSVNNEGYIILADSLDRESTSSYNLTVTVSDSGQPRFSTTGYLYIEVTDINDERPQLERVRIYLVSTIAYASSYNLMHRTRTISWFLRTLR